MVKALLMALVVQQKPEQGNMSETKITGSIVVQRSANFVMLKLFTLAKIQSTITKVDSWRIYCETSGVSNYHLASCLGSAMIWYTIIEMDEPHVTTVKKYVITIFTAIRSSRTSNSRLSTQYHHR